MTDTKHTPTRSTPLRVDVDKMLSRVFITDGQGNRCAESLRRGFAENAVPKLNAHDELVARVAELEKSVAHWIGVYGEMKVERDDLRIALAKIAAAQAPSIPAVMSVARAALAKAGS